MLNLLNFARNTKQKCEKSGLGTNYHQARQADSGDIFILLEILAKTEMFPNDLVNFYIGNLSVVKNKHCSYYQ